MVIQPLPGHSPRAFTTFEKQSIPLHTPPESELVTSMNAPISSTEILLILLSIRRIRCCFFTLSQILATHRLWFCPLLPPSGQPCKHPSTVAMPPPICSPPCMVPLHPQHSEDCFPGLQVSSSLRTTQHIWWLRPCLHLVIYLGEHRPVGLLSTFLLIQPALD